MDWINCSDKLPPFRTYVEVNDPLYGITFVARRTFFLGYWKYRSGLTGDYVSSFDRWRYIRKNGMDKR